MVVKHYMMVDVSFLQLSIPAKLLYTPLWTLSRSISARRSL